MKKNTIKEKSYLKFIFLNKLIAFSFSIVVLLIYFSFIIVIGFAPNLLSIFLFDSYITTGIIVGLSIIIFSILLTFLYTIIANNFLDKIKENIRE